MKDQDTVYSWLFALNDAAAVYQDGVICASNDAFNTYLDSGQSALFEWVKNNESTPFQGVVKDLDGNHCAIHGLKSKLSDNTTLCTLQDVTELEVLKEVQTINQNKFKALSNGTMEGIALFSGDEVVDVNERMVQITGFNEANELIKNGLKGFFKTRDWKRLSTRLNEVFDFEIENSKGIKINIEAQLTSTNKETDNLQALVMLDVTEKKRIERDLLQTKERFRLLVESSPIGLFLVVKNKIRYINQAASSLLGFEDEEEVYNQDISSLFMDSDRQRVLEDMEAVYKGEKPPYIELSMRGLNTQAKAVGIQMGLTFYDQKPAVQITVSDLSTRMMLVREQMRASSAEESNALLKEEIKRHKKTQIQLKEAERLNGSIVESSIDMIVAFDINGNLIQFNHAASVEFGWTFDDAKQLRPKQFLADESEFADVMSELKEKNHFVGELTGLRSSGETFQLLMSVASLRDDDGNTLGAVTVGRDITGLQIA